MNQSEVSDSKPPNPELGETTATALCVLINNHIEVLRKWERKLRGPYMPTTRRHFSVVPEYPKPTLATMLQVLVAVKNFTLEVVKLSTKFLQEYGQGKRHAQSTHDET